jgi:hypothetical protein
LKLPGNGDVGFIGWLDRLTSPGRTPWSKEKDERKSESHEKRFWNAPPRPKNVEVIKDKIDQPE